MIYNINDFDLNEISVPDIKDGIIILKIIFNNIMDIDKYLISY